MLCYYKERPVSDEEAKAISEKTFAPVPDIQVSRTEEKITIEPDGTKTIKYEKKWTNLTREQKATVKLVKSIDAQNKIEELKEALKETK